MMVAISQSVAARDALCELVNIGSGKALTSLSQLLGGGRIHLSLPQHTGVVELGRLEGMADPGMLVRQTVEGVVACTFLALFDESSARRLATSLLAREHDVERIGSLEESALLEAVNILSCAFLGALGTLLGCVLIPSPPVAEYGSLAGLVRGGIDSVDQGLVFTTRFADERAGYRGRIIILTDDGAALAMLAAIGVEP
jgi:chemotaxis protein CheY-P-specific phosphatase CheC